MPRSIHNVNIESILPLESPREIKSLLPVEDSLVERIAGFRDDIVRILNREDKRLLVLVGPCSIHDVKAAQEYAERLSVLRKELAGSLYIVMRVYFDKPRTSLGWRGMIVDPFLDGSYNIQEGLVRARRLMLRITEMGIPIGTEVLDPIIPQYTVDLVSWAAIGARTIESQTHREISSGLSMPVGFKNGTDGNLVNAVNAIRSAREGHSFIGIDQDGRTCVLKTRGNSAGHIILRGGIHGPNYYEENVEETEDLLTDIGLLPAVVVDCSHANSGKDHTRQARVFRAATDLRVRGHQSIRGVMLESNLISGRQEIPEDMPAGRLVYGQSVTDACIGWDETEKLLRDAAEMLGRSGL